MNILFSKYNSPFCEPSTDQVHYISLDDQRDIRAGVFDAHVKAFYSLFPRPVFRSFRTFRTEQFLEVFDPLTGSIYVHDMGGSGLFPLRHSSGSVVSDIDRGFVDSLRKSKIKAALPVMSLCTCGNANRPWRCVCKR